MSSIAALPDGKAAAGCCCHMQASHFCRTAPCKRLNKHVCPLLAALYAAGSATTRPAPPLPPPPPTLSDITSSSFKLSWACPQGRGAPVTDYMVNLQHLHSASLANGHAATSGDSVLESLDDASSTSGSTAHAQVRPMHQLKTQPTANAHNDWLNPPAFAIAYACICSLGSS